MFPFILTIESVPVFNPFILSNQSNNPPSVAPVLLHSITAATDSIGINFNVPYLNIYGVYCSSYIAKSTSFDIFPKESIINTPLSILNFLGIILSNNSFQIYSLFEPEMVP